MKKIKIELENCFGINKLSKDFVFNDKKIICIYARNGIMKTSFAKTFYELSTGNFPKDDLYGKKTNVLIEIDDLVIKDFKNIFVIESLKDFFISDNETASALLVDKDLKKRYEYINKEIIKKKDILIKAISKDSGTKTSTESLINKDFGEENIFDNLYKLSNILKIDQVDLPDIKYGDIFNPDVENILLDQEVENYLNDYVLKYKEVIKEYKFFNEENFNPTKARIVLDSLEKNTFFEPGNTINLIGEKESFNKESFNIKLQEIETKILQNDQLKDISKKIISKVATRNFQDYLVKNEFVLKYLNQSERLNFKKNLWKKYIKKEILLLEDFINYYSSNIKELEKIEKEALKEKPLWNETIQEFKRRFKPPFDILIKNEKSTVLGIDTLKIDFKFFDGENNEKYLSKDEIDGLRFLSQGEKRILYLLYVIFEIKKRIINKIETLIVIDDIADSFDYKNKYGIIQYLRDISIEKNNLFYQIILTHNFDFFRTIFGRLNKNHDSFYFVEKSNKIIVEPINKLHIINPFEDFIKNNNKGKDLKKIISLIPFIRNIIEYNISKPDINDDYLKLTNILHFRKNGIKVKLLEIYQILNKYSDLNFNESLAEDIYIIDKIYELADNIKVENKNFFQLEEKLILSIAIRLSTEEYIKNKLNNRSDIEEKNTYDLIDDYKINFPKDIEIINTLDDVQIMTPENIHINSFMYEPILDMSCDDLIELYNKTQTLKKVIV